MIVKKSVVALAFCDTFSVAEHVTVFSVRVIHLQNAYLLGHMHRTARSSAECRSLLKRKSWSLETSDVSGSNLCGATRALT